VTVRPAQFRKLAKTFETRADLWRRTGGVHACALATPEELVLFAEDVGRHNAFDKVMGRALLDGVGVRDKLVLTTGRLSAEIVSKAAACRVPILASRSAVTHMGIQLARRLNITLIGFLRGRRLSVYTGYDRVAAET
jgi:FdhD protein